MEKQSLLSTKKGSVLCVEELYYASASGVSSTSGQSQWTQQLADVNFVARPGETWACMGRSGPWMSSLLELLACQQNLGRASGRVLYDGNLASPKWRHLLTLVSKENQFSCVSALTVREILVVSGRLRHSEGAEQHADELIELLGLAKCAHVRVGSEMVRGISGGEKKRVAIALGLISFPKIVLLDEPTTGLDSTTALDVMRHVHSSVAVAQGRTVVSSLHMPSADVFLRCDNLLLVREGRVIYAGPSGAALAYFAASPHDASPKARENPADFLLSCAADDRSKLGDEGAALSRCFTTSAAGLAARLNVASEVAAPPCALPLQRVTNADRWRQARTMTWRSLTQFARSTAIWKTSLLKMGWIAFLYASTFKDQPRNATGVANLESCFYFSLMFGILGNLRGIVTLFDERALYEHERSNRAYEPCVYWFVTTVAPLPWLVFVNVVFSTTVFFAVGAGKVEGVVWVFPWYLLVTTLTNLVGFAWAQMLAAWTSSSQIAMSVWQPGVYIWSQTSGFPIKLPVMSHSNPAWVLMTVSFTRWAYEALIVGVFHEGWGNVSAHTILATYGYPLEYVNKLWVLVVPLVCFILAVRAATYPPLKEPPRSLSVVSAHELQKLCAASSPPQNTTTKTHMMIANNPIAAAAAAEAKPQEGGSSSSREEEDARADEAPPGGVVVVVKASTLSTALERVEVSVREIYYSVRVADSKGHAMIKPLLRGVSARVSPGETLAVMGPSGAGKSTFLDLIAGRKTTGFGKGAVLYDGAQPTVAQRHSAQCYVMQHDVLISNLSVCETIRIAALLRLEQPTAATVAERATGITQMLSLDRCARLLVKDLATGERRLAAVAVEMVHLPAVMYFDEPTSGLDSKMSLDFCRAMLRLAQRGGTLLCTIHQPTEEMFNLFHKVLVIGDGRTVYEGAPKHAMANAPPDVRAADRNAAEWLMDAAKRPAPANSDPGMLFAASSSSGTALAFDLDAKMTAGSLGLASALDPQQLRRQVLHFRVHLLRNFLVLSHTRKAIYIAAARNVVVALWYGVVYWKQTDYHSLASVLYFSQQFVTMSNLQAIPQMFDERALFYREVSAGFYSELPYLAARCALNAVVQIPLVFLYSVITYPMVGMRGGVFSQHFVFFYLVLFGLSLAGYSFSNLIAAVTPNQQSALNLYSAGFQFAMFFCGYSIPVDQVPSYWTWATDFSFARWSFESLVLNELGGVKGDDDASAETYLEYWTFSGHDKISTYGIFIFQVAVFHLLAFLAMKFVSFQRT